MSNFNVTIKALETSDKRIVEGWATRPEEDRAGDIVIPEGVKYKLPIPFLLDHNHSKAIGSVDEVTVTKQGIKFRAHVCKFDTDSEVSRACDNAWDLIRSGLRSHVSIGFRTLSYEANENSQNGWIIKEWEWLELSAVTIPALPSAAITGLKKYRAASNGAVRLVKPESVLPKGAVRLIS